MNRNLEAIAQELLAVALRQYGPGLANGLQAQVVQGQGERDMAIVIFSPQGLINRLGLVGEGEGVEPIANRPERRSKAAEPRT